MNVGDFDRFLRGLSGIPGEPPARYTGSMDEKKNIGTAYDETAPAEQVDYMRSRRPRLPCIQTGAFVGGQPGGGKSERLFLPTMSLSADLDRELLQAARARCRNGCGNSTPDWPLTCTRCRDMARFARDVIDEIARQRAEARS